jgi:glycosyltransferase involved in cell wall biosynthesis
MNNPFISYLVTCHNESKQLKDLLSLLCKYNTDGEIIVLDDFSDDINTKEVLSKCSVVHPMTLKPNFTVHQHALNNNYGEHKNYGKSLCKGEYIFQIDADELPAESLLEDLPDILKENPATELFWIPRINMYEGVTEQHAKMWGWDINNPGKWVNWNGGDYQTRIFKNLPNIKWEGRLHEKIIGHKTFAHLPKEEELALYHRKTMEKQMETNLRYNKLFTVEENKGYKVTR